MPVPQLLAIRNRRYVSGLSMELRSRLPEVRPECGPPNATVMRLTSHTPSLLFGISKDVSLANSPDPSVTAGSGGTRGTRDGLETPIGGPTRPVPRV